MEKTLTREEVVEEAIDLAEDLIETGADEDRAVELVVDFVDRLVPLDVIIPGPAGAVAEAVDGPAFLWLATKIREALRRDPEKRAEAKARRATKKSERRRRREARRESHRAGRRS